MQSVYNKMYHRSYGDLTNETPYPGLHSEYFALLKNKIDRVFIWQHYTKNSVHQVTLGPEEIPMPQWNIESNWF